MADFLSRPSITALDLPFRKKKEDPPPFGDAGDTPHTDVDVDGVHEALCQINQVHMHHPQSAWERFLDATEVALDPVIIANQAGCEECSKIQKLINVPIEPLSGYE